jgi:hypothetical protein
MHVFLFSLSFEGHEYYEVKTDEVDQEAKKFEQVAVGSKQSSLAVR